jgi:hypothetical protein
VLGFRVYGGKKVQRIPCQQTNSEGNYGESLHFWQKGKTKQGVEFARD